MPDTKNIKYNFIIKILIFLNWTIIIIRISSFYTTFKIYIISNIYCLKGYY